MTPAVLVGEPAAESPEARRLEDDRLLLSYHREGNLEARDELVVRFMPLARQLAARYRHAGEPLEDLVQVACVGLIKAVDRYDPDRGNGFTRYAVPTMLGEIKRHFRDKGWSVHVPRATQELVLKVGEALGALPAKIGRSPTPRDVALAVGAPVEDVLEAMEAATAYEAVSLDAPRPGSAEEESWTLADSLTDEEHGLRARRDRRDAARHAGGAARARATDPAPALRGGHDAGRDRRAGRRLPDARVATAAPLTGPALRSRRGGGVACGGWRRSSPHVQRWPHCLPGARSAAA